MVVSVFTGCGKTWLANHQNKYGYSMRDSDSSTYEKTAGWEKEYINSFMEEAKSGKYDFIFVCQTESVIDEMDRQKIPYVIVEPDNIDEHVQKCIWYDLKNGRRMRYDMPTAESLYDYLTLPFEQLPLEVDTGDDNDTEAPDFL